MVIKGFGNSRIAMYIYEALAIAWPFGQWPYQALVITVIERSKKS